MINALFKPALVALMLVTGGCVQAESPRKPPRLLTNEEGCSITIDDQPIDPYQDPAPLERACVGPYALELPQNYFSTQMGPQHDGSFSLALEYPSLKPFKPGERIDLNVDVAIRTVRVRYSYLRWAPSAEVMRSQYTPMTYQQGNPAASLDDRIKGPSVYGLESFYIDMDKVRRYHRAGGGAETAPVMSPEFHKDWFVSRDARGVIEQVIKCTPKEITESGVEYRSEKMVKKRVVGFASCEQTFVIQQLNTLVSVDYPREGMERWSGIKARVSALLNDNIVRGGN